MCNEALTTMKSLNEKERTDIEQLAAASAINSPLSGASR